MDKADAIQAFVLSLKVAVRNASIYTLEHPAFAEGIVDLRKKLEDDPSHPVHLISVRGAGYRFVPA